jgi:hypothetical protein
MNARLMKFSTPLLRWTLGLMVILESGEFLFSASAAHFLAKTGWPAWLRPVLGGSEIIAAVFFLVPFTTRFGGYLLLVIFGLAALLHILHGQYGVEGLLVYAVAATVCISHAENKTPEARDERP